MGKLDAQCHPRLQQVQSLCWLREMLSQKDTVEAGGREESPSPRPVVLTPSNKDRSGQAPHSPGPSSKSQAWRNLICAQSPAGPSPTPLSPAHPHSSTHTPIPKSETKRHPYTLPIIQILTAVVLPENQPRKPEVGEDREGGGSTLCPWVDSEPTAHNPVKILILIYPGREAAAVAIKPLRSNKRQAADKVGRPLIKPHRAKVSQCLAISVPPPGLWPQEPDALGTMPAERDSQPGWHRGREEEAGLLRSTLQLGDLERGGITCLPHHPAWVSPKPWS